MLALLSWIALIATDRIQNALWDRRIDKYKQKHDIPFWAKPESEEMKQMKREVSETCEYMKEELPKAIEKMKKDQEESRKKRIEEIHKQYDKSQKCAEELSEKRP